MAVRTILVGDPEPTGAKVSVEPDGTTATVEVSTDPAFSSVTTFGPTAVNGSGFSKISLSGLTASTQYYVRARDTGVLDTSKVGKFRTPGPVGTPQDMLIAASGCAQGTNYPGSTTKVSNSPVFDTIRGWDPDEFVHLGDAHYRNINSNDISLYRQAYKDMFAEPRQNQFWREIPVAYVWDDHDWANNDSDSTALGAAEVSQVYREIFPSYPTADFATTAGIYRSWERGRVLNIMSDTRHDRVPGVTMLGSAQKTWMESVLTSSTAEFLVWWNPTPWMGNAADTWNGFLVERDEIRDLFVTTGWADRMVCINADYHGLAMDTGSGNLAKTGATWPVYLWCALDSGLEAGETGSTQYDMGTASVGSNRYGLLDITDDGDLITVTGTAYIGTTPWRSNTQYVVTTAGTIPPRDLSLLYDDELSRVRITSAEVVPSYTPLIDTFDRTVAAGGWGSANTGQAWTVSGGAAANFSVSTGRGRIGMTPDAVRHWALSDQAYSDVEFFTSFIVPATATGGNIGGGAIFRATDTSNHYMAQVLFQTTGALRLDLYKNVAGSFTAIGSPVTLADTYSGAARVNLRVKTEGSVLQVKAWNNLNPEPASYTITESDATYTTGKVGVTGILFTGNTNTEPVACSVEDFITAEPDGVFLRFERSTNQVTWETVRGGELVTAPVSVPITIDDYEFTPDVANYYRVTVVDAEGTPLDEPVMAVTTPPMTSVWLKSPSRPFLNLKVSVVEMGDVTEPARSTVFPIAGSAKGVAVSGTRGGREFDLQILTDTLEEQQRIRSILAVGEPLLVHVPVACPIPVPTMYAHIADVSYSRPGRLSPVQVITLPMTEVEAPGPDVVGVTITWDGVASMFATWGELEAAVPTWNDLQDYVES